MESAQFCLLALTGVAAAILIREARSDLLPAVRLAIAVLLAFAVLEASTPVVSFLRELTGTAALSGNAGVLFKALGIAFLTEICAGICRDCGESGAATGVEWIGKAEILLLCLPLMEDLLSLARSLLSAEGGI